MNQLPPSRPELIFEANLLSKMHQSSHRTMSTSDLSIPITISRSSNVTTNAGETTASTITPKESKMKRRNALISRHSSPIHRENQSCSDRKYLRRDATCGSPKTIRDAKTALKGCRTTVNCATIAMTDSFVPSATDVLFDQDGISMTDHQGNVLFWSILEFACDEMYRFSNPTQRTIIVHSILEDMKSKSLRFYMKFVDDDVIKFHEIPDSKIIKLIKNNLESKRTLLLRNFTAKSA